MQSASDIKAELDYLANAPAEVETRRAEPQNALAVGTRWDCGAGVTGGDALDARPFCRALGFTGAVLIHYGWAVGDGAPEPSPDGRYFVANPLDSSEHRLLWLRAIDQPEGHWIPGTDGAGAPFWSARRPMDRIPCGRTNQARQPWRGIPQTVVEVPSVYAATWNSRGDIIFAPNNRSGLYLIKEGGGPAQAITKLDAGRTENSHRWPRFLADGRHFVFTARCTEAKNDAIYLGSLHSSETKRLLYTESQAVPIPDGLLYVREGTLFRQNLKSLQAAGEPIVLSEKVLHSTISAQAAFGASMDGRVVLTRPASSVGIL